MHTHPTRTIGVTRLLLKRQRRPYRGTFLAGGVVFGGDAARGKLPEFREFSLSRIPASGQPRNRSAAAGIADLTEIHCID